jgi:WD40 repeat protein
VDPSLVCPPFEQSKEVMAAGFTPFGDRVVSASHDGTSRVWDWKNGKPLTPPLANGGYSLNVAVTRDREHAVVAGFHDALTVLDLSGLVQTDGDPSALCRWAELLAGTRHHEGGGMV